MCSFVYVLDQNSLQCDSLEFQLFVIMLSLPVTEHFQFLRLVTPVSALYDLSKVHGVQRETGESRAASTRK